MSQVLDEVLSADAAYAASFVAWLTIDQPHDAVITDVRRIRSHPLVPPAVAIYGYFFDVKTGALVEVPAATRIGAATNPRK